MSLRLVARIEKLIKFVVESGGFGSVTILIERGRVARIVWSVYETVND